MLARRSFLGLAIVTAIMPMEPASAQKRWKTYRNERFGTSIEYPADRFHALPPPENGDGLRFEASDGAEFVVSAIRNALEETFAEIQESYLERDGQPKDITYRTKGKNWFVYSGTRGDMIFYERHLASHRNELINMFEITYPASLKHIYDLIAARMSRTLRAHVGWHTGPL